MVLEDSKDDLWIKKKITLSQVMNDLNAIHRLDSYNEINALYPEYNPTSSDVILIENEDSTPNAWMKNKVSFGNITMDILSDGIDYIRMESSERIKLSSITSSGTDIADSVLLKHTQGTDTTLGIQIQNSDWGTHRITNAGEPIDNADYATKYYVDNMPITHTKFVTGDEILDEGCYNSIYLCDTSITNPINISLPKITSDYIGRKVTFIFYKYNIGMNDGLIISSDILDAFVGGGTTFILYNGESVSFVHDGMNTWSPYNYCTNNTLRINQKHQLNNEFTSMSSLQDSDLLIVESISDGIKYKCSRIDLLGYKSIFIEAETNTAILKTRLRPITGTGTFNFNFHLPYDFKEFGPNGGIYLSGYVTNGAAQTNRNIALTTIYDSGNLSWQQDYMEGDSGLLYDLSAYSGKRIDLPFRQYVTNGSAGTCGGVNVDHLGINGNINYMGIYVVCKP
jgi:hypothetical protein